FATTGDMAAKLGCFILSPFTGGWLRLQCKGTIQIVNGCFQLTKIGVFRLTRNGDYRLTLTMIPANYNLWHFSIRLSPFFRPSLSLWALVSASGVSSTCWKVTATTTPVRKARA